MISYIAKLPGNLGIGWFQIMHPGIIHDYNFHRFTNHVLPLVRQRDRCSKVLWVLWPKRLLNKWLLVNDRCRVLHLLNSFSPAVTQWSSKMYPGKWSDQFWICDRWMTLRMDRRGIPECFIQELSDSIFGDFLMNEQNDLQLDSRPSEQLHQPFRTAIFKTAWIWQAPSQYRTGSFFVDW